MKRKVILSMPIANELLADGFRIIELRPSRKFKGMAVFVFQVTDEFNRALSVIAKREGLRL
ncbi:hypothetical protein KM915_10360 [Cytobacillus oceanisediminis]|uniref:hypothetical protein n=1 Tax=Cytobacillus oceanisediminis TaxID=665099 RepID=UPI001C22AE85|nr:hypothetical protein [Cytobacillus oceanisediminis]MBU8730456.1 hypothetical protein [Cytobacillus oceanisediminis]